MNDTEKLQSLKSQIKALEQKKPTLTDAAGLKALNKQINALQEEIGKLRKDISRYASLNRDSIRDYHEMVLGDLE